MAEVEEPTEPVYCIADNLGGETLGGASAPYYPEKRWTKKQLKVAFVNEPLSWRFTKYPKDFITTDHILTWANEWSSERHGLNGIVPVFVPCREEDKDNSDIRVKFMSKVGSESLIGTEALDHQDKEYTMILNLSSNNDDYRQYVVIHEFGHSLGLGHEHQTSHLAGVIDEDAMIMMLQKWGMSYTKAIEKFKKDYGQYSDTCQPKEWSEFDPQSVMCYPIPVECIKESFRDKIPQIDKITSQRFNQRKNLSLVDIKTIKELYSSGNLLEKSCKSFRRHLPMSAAVVQYIAHLHETYQRRILPVSKGQPTPAKHYINLAIVSKEDVQKEKLDEFTLLTVHGKVDDIIKKKKPIELEQIGRDENGGFVKCVLVEGAPGVGKTTLAWELCRRWKEILKEFEIVLLLTLRDRSIQKAESLSELFQHPNKEIQKEVAHEITKDKGPSVLLILEGYDEMPAHIQIDSLFSRIIEGTGFPQASVLITTRPSSGRIVHEKCEHQKFQHIEVVGFTNTDINRYIHDVMGQDETSMNKFYKYLDRHPQIRTMMSNPLNCGLTIKCFRHYGISDVALRTQTELYSNVTKMLVFGELSSMEEYSHLKGKPVKMLSDLPEEIHQKLLNLSQFAYKGIVKNVLVHQEFPSHLDPLGLVQKSEDINAPGSFSYNFIHLTIQEYLAAYHISTLPPSKQAECIDTHIHQDHMQMVLRFLAGLTKFKFSTSTSADHSSFVESLKGAFGRTPIKRLKLYIHSPETRFFMESVHWLLEIQDKKLVQSTVGQQTHKHILSYQTLNPFNCYALGYCIENSDCQWKLELRSCSINNEAAKALCQGSLRNVETLDLSGNKACDIGSHLSSALQNNRVLTELRVEGCGMSEEGTTELTNALQYIPSLRVLDLSLNDVGVKAAKNIGKCCTNALQLYLIGCGISDEKISEMASGLPLQSMSLKELWLQANPIGEHGAYVLAEVIKNTTTLTLLSLLGCSSIGDQGASTLVRSLLSNTSIKHLQLAQNFKTACQGIQDIVSHRIVWCTDFTKQSVVKIESQNVDCKVIACALRGNTTLTELKLVDCSIGVSDIVHLRQALRGIHSVTALDLSRNTLIGKNGTKELALLLMEHTQLKELSLVSCAIKSNGVSNLILCLKNIIKLDLGFNTDIRIVGAKYLAQALEENNSLTHLRLSYCSIDAEGMAYLSSSLRHMPLQCLDVGGNWLASKGDIDCLVPALVENTTLTHLELFESAISTDTMAQLSLLLKHKPLQYLDFNSNPFGLKGAEYLVDTLKECTKLTELRMYYCGIDDRGGDNLREALRNINVEIRV